MGNTPSQRLFKAAQGGDLQAAIAARQQGGDVNYQEPSSSSRSSLHIAARNGHTSVVAWLLAQGALDLFDSEGISSLMTAVKYGHASIAAILLDRGCDIHHYSKSGQTAVDVAGLASQKQCVRLLEARSCPFAWSATMFKPGVFANEWKERWLAVYRARPWDNPLVDRQRITLYIYESRDAALAERVLLRPCLLHVARGAGGFVDADLACESSRTAHGSGLSTPPIRFRFDGPTYDWLAAVLHDSFATGRGPAFDPVSRHVLQPPQFLHYTQQYSTASLAGPQHTASALPPPTLSPQQLRGAGGGYPVPSAPPSTSSPPGPSAPPLSSLPHYTGPSAPPASSYLSAASAGAASMGGAAPQPFASGQGYPAAQQQPYASAPPAAAQQALQRTPPSYLHGSVLALQRALTEGTLLPEGAPSPPDQFVCSITQEIMLDPVTVSDGSTYSREGIEGWIESQTKAGKPVISPLTRAVISAHSITPNTMVRGMILDWVEKVRKDAAKPGGQ